LRSGLAQLTALIGQRRKEGDVECDVAAVSNTFNRFQPRPIQFEFKVDLALLSVVGRHNRQLVRLCMRPPESASAGRDVSEHSVQPFAHRRVARLHVQHCQER